ncbi:hypothetical protein KDW_27580 [Dictyobacter vulcani]|uniref:Uncharacterized protein n=1 Tax=Dictyobacter vulcani TaxID=2607529 RepID=A0A5J4KTR9_9CHLR|nr:hypothetical protein [Dictyobacter vulcani]GER88596.1 hypothetical protein KDW_27580 [Dictyobacter vulcani]
MQQFQRSSSTQHILQDSEAVTNEQSQYQTAEDQLDEAAQAAERARLRQGLCMCGSSTSTVRWKSSWIRRCADKALSLVQELDGPMSLVG